MRRSIRVLLVTTTLSGTFGLGCATTDFGQGTTTVGVKPPPPEPPPPVKAEAPAPKRVQLTDKRITIAEKIQFDFDKATIKSVSDSLIAEIADVIKTNPQLKKIRVEGHASKDKKGEEEHDQKLSEGRAKAVLDALVTKGVNKDVLLSQGFGETVPIASNDTEEGREKNRRVDFVILDPAPATGGDKK